MRTGTEQGVHLQDIQNEPGPAGKLDMQNGSLGGQRLDRCKDGRDYEQPSRGKGDGQPGLWF